MIVEFFLGLWNGAIVVAKILWAIARGVFNALGSVLQFVPWWVWSVLVVGFVLHGCQMGNQRDAARLDAAGLREVIKSDTIERTELARRAEADRRERMSAFAAALNNINRKDADEKLALAADVERLRRELRQRPERPAAGGAGVPGGTGPGVGACTGAGLYRADADFLVGEAAAAKTLSRQLASCRSKYDAAVTLTRRATSPGLSVLTGAPVSSPKTQP